MHAVLDQTLRSVPMLATLGIRVEEARTGLVVMRLQASEALRDHSGALHSSALFALGETTAATLLGTHPELEGLHHFLKSSRIKYFGTSREDVVARAEMRTDAISGLIRQLEMGAAPVEVSVPVTDGEGRDLAQVLCHFSLERRRSVR